MHGVAFSAWMVLVLTQSLLVRAGQVQIHRRLGIAGAVLAAAMVVLGVQIARVAAAQGTIGLLAHRPPLEFLIIPLGQVLIFGGLVATAILPAPPARGAPAPDDRRNPPAHRARHRARLDKPASHCQPHRRDRGHDLLVAACIVYDKRTRGRVHPVFAVLAPLTILSFPLRILISHTQPGSALRNGWCAACRPDDKVMARSRGNATAPLQ